MRILVAIANYGMKNFEYAKQLAQEYLSMPFHVDVFFLAESQKDYGLDVNVIVGLPSKDPWSLPFGHRTLFRDNVNRYDLFVYSEDDTLITKENIFGFLQAVEHVDGDCLPGFVRYELYPDGKKNFPDVHGPDHWLPSSVKRHGSFVTAEFSNAHSACYMLTAEQLRTAIESGGYLVKPHSGRYDLLCSAATDPYTQCGFRRVICISHMKDFEVHHVPNTYVDRLGLNEEKYRSQIQALNDVLADKRPIGELVETVKPVDTPLWDKSYYEKCRMDLTHLIPDDAEDILSVGCGWGETEAFLMRGGRQVTAIPLDSVVGKVAEGRGIKVLPPDFDRAFALLDQQEFDVVLLSDIVQHLQRPKEIVVRLGDFLNGAGLMIGSVPNLGFLRRMFGRLAVRSNKWMQLTDSYETTRLNFTSVLMIRKLLRSCSLDPGFLGYDSSDDHWHRFSSLPRRLESIGASRILFTAKPIRE